MNWTLLPTLAIALLGMVEVSLTAQVIRTPPQQVWIKDAQGGRRLAEMGYGGTNLRIADSKTLAWRKVEAPECVEVPSYTVGAGWIRTCGVQEDAFLLWSRPLTGGSWHSEPLDVDGRATLKGHPFGLFATDDLDLCLGFDVSYYGAALEGSDASFCAWWVRRPGGRWSIKGIVPLEWEGKPVCDTERVPEGHRFGKMSAQRQGLAPFLDHPIRVPGGFVLVSWQAGVLWYLKDGAPFVSRTTELVAIKEEHARGTKPLHTVMLGAQPTPEGKVLLAYRPEAVVLEAKPFEEPEKPRKGEPRYPSVSVYRDPRILYREYDPETGSLKEVDPKRLEGMPTEIPTDYAGRRFALRWNPDGTLDREAARPRPPAAKAPEQGVPEPSKR